MSVIRGLLVNSGLAAHSERAIRLFSEIVRCSLLDIRCWHESTGDCTFNERGMTHDAIARVIPKLRHRNANGSGVFVRPSMPFALADDVHPGTIERMLDDDLRIAAAVETSPGSFQVWVPLAGPLRSVEQEICAAACERLAELYSTDIGVAHRDSFGRAPGFFNKKPMHEQDGKSPLVRLSNRISGFRGYDRTLLDEAFRETGKHPKPLGKRSAGAVLFSSDYTINDTHDDRGPIEIYQGGRHVATFSAISADLLFENWLADMQVSGYALPQRINHSGTDRSQRDLDVLRSMHVAGVSRGVAQAALEAGSDKAQERSAPYVHYLLSTVWGES